jgi:hypothetical protein
VVMKTFVFWDIPPCIPLKISWSFGGTCRSLLRCRRISQAGNYCESREQAMCMSLRNFSWLPTDYVALPRRIYNSSSHPEIALTHGEVSIAWIPTLCGFLKSIPYFLCPGLNGVLINLFSDPLIIYSSSRARDQVSRPYKTVRDYK